MSLPLRLTPPQAARIALAAQGFGDRRPAPGAATMRHVQRVVDRVAVVQIDSVNVLTRSHYLPFFSRLGPYDTAIVDRARDRGPRRLVEYWAHEASLIPPATWPLLDFRMARASDGSWGGMRQVARSHPELVAAVLQEVTEHGPLTSREGERRLSQDVPHARERWGWNWSLVKNALEHLFWAGRISSAGRNSQFERRYDLSERVLPPAQREAAVDAGRRPASDDAVRELVRIAARAHGVGTLLCLRDYFRLKSAQAAPAIAQLVATGELIPCEVAGWPAPAYLHAEAARPRRMEARTILSPFDSLVWQRDRAQQLFGFSYRLSIYTPAQHRADGYYVLPFLLGQDLVGRVDLKADRRGDVLIVRALRWEPDAPAEAEQQLREHLREVADWLGLSHVTALPE